MNVIVIADDDSLIGGIDRGPVDLLISCGESALASGRDHGPNPSSETLTATIIGKHRM